MSADCTCRPIDRGNLGRVDDDGDTGHAPNCDGPVRVVAQGRRPIKYDEATRRPRLASLTKRRAMRTRTI
jgi:hypothetical protein